MALIAAAGATATCALRAALMADVGEAVVQLDLLSGAMSAGVRGG